MEPISVIRRRNLAALVAKAGGQGPFADKIVKDKNQVYQWLIEDETNVQSRKMSHATARKIEHACALPRGWLDVLHEVGAGEPAAQSQSQAVRTQRETMRAAARLLEGARGFIIGTVDEDALIDSALEAAEEIGPARILNGDAMIEGVRLVASKIRAN